MKKIILAGSFIIDKLYEISSYPECGKLEQIKAVKQSVGGLVPNVGVDIKALQSGIPVFAVAKAGNDSDGKFITEVLDSYGINTESVVMDEKLTTSFSVVMSVIGGQRTFFTYSGASSEFGFEDIPFDIMENGDILHLGYFLLLDKIDNGDGEKILKKAAESGIETSIDLVSENTDRYKIVLPCLKYVDNLIINEIEAGKLTGIIPDKENLKAMCEKLSEFGVRKRIIIHTPEIGVCFDKNGFTYLPSFKLEKDFIKGTTGAGDAYCAGALVGIYNGLEPMEILKLARVSATCNLTSTDSIGGAKSKAEAEELCKNFKGREICL